MVSKIKSRPNAVITKFRLGGTVIDFTKTDRTTLRVRTKEDPTKMSYLIRTPYLTSIAAERFVDRIRVDTEVRGEYFPTSTSVENIIKVYEQHSTIAEHSYWYKYITSRSWFIMDDIDMVKILDPSTCFLDNFPIVSFLDKTPYHIDIIDKNFLDLCPMLCVDSSIIDNLTFHKKLQEIEDIQRTTNTTIDKTTLLSIFPFEALYYTIKIVTEPGYFYNVEELTQQQTTLYFENDRSAKRDEFESLKKLLDIFSNSEIRFLTKAAMMETFNFVVSEIKRLQ